MSGLPCDFVRSSSPGTAREGLLNQFRLVAWTFLRKDPLSIEFMSCDKSSCAGVYFSWLTEHLWCLWFGILGSSQSDRLSIIGYIDCQGLEWRDPIDAKRNPWGNWSWVQWKMTRGSSLRAERQRNSQSRFLGIEWGERLDNRRTPNHFLCLPGSWDTIENHLTILSDIDSTNCDCGGDAV